ncbi:Uncharacterised protein [Neisseria gonorrhoeae]|uniref:Uncharacterized protein n=1 Tax=Neisseria gonorrhoeae TaxID=485 RepID=A0A378VZ54_NEIGO|nr:Uncharacterised protein [Neisseria gonorrhoeae]
MKCRPNALKRVLTAFVQTGLFALQYGGEEAVGLVSGGIEAQVFAGIQIDLQVLQQFGAVDGFKFGMFGQETFDLQFVSSGNTLQVA